MPEPLLANPVTVPVTSGQQPFLFYHCHSGIVQQLDVQYMTSETLIGHKPVNIQPNDPSWQMLDFERAIYDSTLIISFAALGANFVNPQEPTLSRVRKALGDWAEKYDYAFESDDFWNNDTWDDLVVGVAWKNVGPPVGQKSGSDEAKLRMKRYK